MITPVLPTYARAKVAFDRGEGVRVFTPEGEAYLDFGAGVAVTRLAPALGRAGSPGTRSRLHSWLPALG